MEENFSKYLKNFLNKYQYSKYNELYLINYEEKPFILQFMQLINYFNFKKDLDKILSEDKSEKNSNFIQNQYYLIDKEWIEKWKKHVGYNEVINYLNNNNMNMRLNYNDYIWIIPIIEKNSKLNLLSPTDNFKPFEKDEINPLVEFEILNRKCYELFNIDSKNHRKYSSFPIAFFKEKYLLILEPTIILISFKEKNSQDFFQLIFVFKKENLGKKSIINDLKQKDLNEYFKEIYFNVTIDLDKTLILHNCIIQIINKTLKLKLNKDNDVDNKCIKNFNNNYKKEEIINQNNEKNLKKMIILIMKK